MPKNADLHVACGLTLFPDRPIFVDQKLMETAKIKNSHAIFLVIFKHCVIRVTYFLQLEWVEFDRNPPVKGFVRIYNWDKNWAYKIVWPHLHFFKVHSWIKIPAHLLTFLKRLVHPIEVRRCVRHFFAYLGEAKEIKNSHLYGSE